MYIYKWTHSIYTASGRAHSISLTKYSPNVANNNRSISNAAAVVTELLKLLESSSKSHCFDMVQVWCRRERGANVLILVSKVMNWEVEINVAFALVKHKQESRGHNLCISYKSCLPSQIPGKQLFAFSLLGFICLFLLFLRQTLYNGDCELVLLHPHWCCNF